MPSWTEATAVQQLSSHTYTATLHDDWCIGSVPNGGYVTGTILQVVSTHFHTTLSSQNQPHTITLHVEFLRRTQAGPATFVVEDAKLGRQTSTVHITMSQGSRKEVVAYVTNSNLATESGFSYDTQYQLHPPVPGACTALLESDADPNWKRAATPPFAKFRKAAGKLLFYYPRQPEPSLAVADEWMCMADGSNFTDTSIAFAADMFPLLVERYRDKTAGPFWYPTLLLNLDVKKALPPQGVKWLQVRVEMKRVRNGRTDLEVFLHDEGGDLVALSHHVGFVLSAARNTAARGKGDTKL